jgi:hypothetical protein
VGGKVELGFARASASDLLLKCAVKTEYANRVALRISDKKAVSDNCDGARALKMISHLESQFAVFAKNNDPAKDRIRHKERAISFCHGHGRPKVH